MLRALLLLASIFSAGCVVRGESTTNSRYSSAYDSYSISTSTSTNPSCSGVVNENDVWDSEPKLLRTVENGTLSIIGEGADRIYLLHVFGDAYSQGFAHGQLLADELADLMPMWFDYLVSQVNMSIPFLPQQLVDEFELYGLDAVLDLTYDLTVKHTPQHYIDETQGLADGSGLDVKMFQRSNMLPELVKAGCTMVGAWGDATPTGGLQQLRALDWDTSGNIQKYALVTVYHPEDNNGHPFATMGFAGFIGALTGFSSVPLGVCEKVWLSPPSYDFRSGTPWMYVLRDILQFDQTLADAASRLFNAQRTCSIYVGVGDGRMGEFRGFKYSFEEVLEYDDMNYPTTDTIHSLFPGMVYWDKHRQPSHDPCLPALLDQYYGRFDGPTTIKQITSQFETGTLHIAFMDHEEQVMYVSSARATEEDGPLNAYDRQFSRLDMAVQFAVERPGKTTDITTTDSLYMSSTN